MPLAVARVDHREPAVERAGIAAGADQELVALDNRVDVADELHLGRRQDDEVVADALQVGDDVGGEQDGHSALGGGFHEGLEEGAPGQGIERGGGLVQHEQLRSLGERQRQGDLGALATRELANTATQGDAEPREPLLGDGIVPGMVQFAPHREHLGDGEAPVERLLLGHWTTKPMRGNTSLGWACGARPKIVM